MPLSARALALCFFTSALLWAPGCANQDGDPTPQPPVQPTPTTGTVTGNFSPAGALASVTATPAAGGAAINATLLTGAYSFAALPPGTYTLTYGPAAGYAAPAPQTVTVTAGATTLAPPLTVGPAGSALPEHLTLGNPSGATTDVNQTSNYLLDRLQYAVSYNRDQGKPNWVSWHLSTSWIGSAARQDDFRADPDLPAGWYAPGATSYTGSGFDRGHNCPSADRTSTVADNSATFFMSNMMPQAPRNNQQTWANLEDYCRTFLSSGNEVYVICGSYGQGGTGANGFATTLDQGRIRVPARCWKVVVILPVGTNDAARVSAGTRVIAIDTPNDNSISTTWGTYRTSVDAIEAATGLDIMSAVPASVQQVVEARVDNGPTS
ncbi:DNA/RNA non-specific endonuclease [Hymenobacter sp. 5317J-9]|uniref:DNA/RNA non-specific endonuclease n=1 Tax=Hymenobacter sp. 5317J-9 TaxID=2932250 RepID=UPI001FD67DD9|nr:DNA/RNA non-specific endonuclease [Hymenobacter sp. 5317J-9]UOQ99920.1 DNA/RNA non-specific endonuclease [Hymenobacter sp. 5317J-9]